MATAQRFQRVTDLHGTFLMFRKAVFGTIIGQPESTQATQKRKIGFIPPTAAPPGTRGF
jgi:hypothetical protein